MQTRRRAQQGVSDAPLPSQPAREPDPWLTPARVRLKERCERLLQKLKTQFAAPLASGALTLPSLFQLAGPCTAAGGLVDMYNEQEALDRARELVAAPSGDDAPPAAAKEGYGAKWAVSRGGFDPGPPRRQDSRVPYWGHPPRPDKLGCCGLAAGRLRSSARGTVSRRGFPSLCT